jgi:dCTP deaminase
MILTGKAIREAWKSGDIEIDPFCDDQINPASYDLRLGDEVATYEFNGLVHDVRDPPARVEKRTIQSSGVIVRPGVGYLMHTRERVKTDKYAPEIGGKSSIGRLFISVHQTAGIGDSGFDGQYTLEVTSLYPIRLYAGMRIAQIRFHEMVGEPLLYAGNYVGAAAKGPVPSRAHRQFGR